MSFLGKWFGFSADEIYEEAAAAFERGDYECAADGFESLLKDGADAETVRIARFQLLESYAAMAKEAFRAGRFEAAVSGFKEALRLAPNYPDLHLYLARCYREVENFSLVDTHVRAALLINPKYSDAIAFEGAVLYERGQQDEGLARAAEACELDPTLSRERYEAALRFDSGGSYSRAAANLLALASSVAADANLHGRLGDSFAREGLHEDAAREYRAALTIAPYFADIRCRLGKSLLAAGYVREAAHELSEALRINDRYADAHACLAEAFRQLELHDEAAVSLQRARDLGHVGA